LAIRALRKLNSERPRSRSTERRCRPPSAEREFVPTLRFASEETGWSVGGMKNIDRLRCIGKAVRQKTPTSRLP
jgi:hypothetical protein